MRFGSIGDIILITPLLRALRTRHQEAYVVVVTKEVFRPLLSDNPNVDRVVGLVPGTPLRQLAADLRTERFTMLNPKSPKNSAIALSSSRRPPLLQ